MGYTHYWRRRKTISKEDMATIVKMFKVVCLWTEKYYPLKDGLGEGEPLIDELQGVVFNGNCNCGHEPHGLGITWPSDSASGIQGDSDERDGADGQWLGGAKLNTRTCDGDCSHETFSFPRIRDVADWDEPENGKYFSCCKTAYKPYDLSVVAFLTIAKHVLGDKLEVSSDGHPYHWEDGVELVRKMTGVEVKNPITEKYFEVTVPVKVQYSMIEQEERGSWETSGNGIVRVVYRVCAPDTQSAIKSGISMAKKLIPATNDNEMHQTRSEVDTGGVTVKQVWDMRTRPPEELELTYGAI